MNMPALVCLLLCIFIAPKAVNAQKPAEIQPLADIQGVKILIENLDKHALQMGLTKESLSDQVLVALKRDLPKLKISDDAKTAIYVNILSIEATSNGAPIGAAVCLSIEVIRPVWIVGDAGKQTWAAATVWDKAAIVVGGTEMPSRIRDQLSAFLTEFAAKYYKDNP